MKRGEIYYIKNDHGQIGHEIMKDRPAVIVSNDGYNEKSGMVTVVYLTRTPREDLVSHVTIRSTGRTSEALCEQISTISASRVNRYMGTVTPDELRRIEAGIQIHLAMSATGQESTENFAGGGQTVQNLAPADPARLIRAEAERDTLRRVCDQMLEHMTKGGKRDVGVV